METHSDQAVDCPVETATTKEPKKLLRFDELVPGRLYEATLRGEVTRDQLVDMPLPEFEISHDFQLLEHTADEP